MPWSETSAMDARLRFLADYQLGAFPLPARNGDLESLSRGLGLC